MEDIPLRHPFVGFLVLILKLGPKLFPLFKSLGDELFLFAKTLMGAAGATAAVSASIYAYLFTWQTGIGLIVFLIMHEYGHVWAMRKCGVGARGMYFIPFMGAVAVMDNLVHSAKNESFISIMGPVFGFVFFVFPGYLWWLYTGDEVAAAVTAVAGFINLINLLPIMPLDGGRMLKSIGYSDNAARSLLLIGSISAITAFGAWYVGFTLFALMAAIGFLELFTVFGIGHRMQNLMGTLLRALVVYVGFIGLTELVMPILGASDAWQRFLVLLVPLLLTYLVASDVHRLKEGGESFLSALFNYPVRVLLVAWGTIADLRELRTEHIQEIENYEPMGKEPKLLYALLTLVLGAMHFVVMLQLGNSQTGAIFSDMLK